MIKILRKLYFTSLALALISTLLPSAMTMEEKNSQDLNLISIPKGFINDRSDELKELIHKTYLSISTRSIQGFTWMFNGSSLYNPMRIDDYQFIRKCLKDNNKNEFYFLDIGAGKGNWGESLGICIENYNQFPPNAKVHIISVTGDNFQSYVSEQPRYTHYYFGGVSIENITEEFKKLGYNFDNKIDFAVSRYTFVHLHDPVGTFCQIYNMLSPETGMVYTDGFPVLYNGYSVSDFYGETVQFLKDIGSPFLINEYVPQDEATCRGLYPFILKRMSSDPFFVPYKYNGISTMKIGQGVSGGIAKFIRKVDSEQENYQILSEKSYFGTSCMHSLLKEINEENK